MSTSFNPNPSPLNNLAPEQSDQLFDWLETHDVPEVLNLIARPAPDGFGIATHDTTLRRWHRREKLARRPADLQLRVMDAPPHEINTRIHTRFTRENGRFTRKHAKK